MNTQDTFRLIVGVLGAVFTIIVFGAMSWKVYRVLDPQLLRALVANHFSGVVIMPMNTMLAALVVIAFRTASGPLEFEGLGFKFKGAAGETAMWIACFVALSLVVKMLF